MLPSGVYEQLINAALRNTLTRIDTQVPTIEPVDEAEASQLFSRYLSMLTEKTLNELYESGGLEAQLTFMNQLIASISVNRAELSIPSPAELLLSLKDKANTLQTEYVRPETSIAHSSLFTGAMHEPSMVTELKKEIQSADRIDMLVSFVKWSGLRMILDELRAFTQRGGKLRVITTSYMGATDLKAVEELNKLPNTMIKVSYDTQRTRLHAKTYVFHRNSGFSTAYVGSSNLTRPAISSGLEWNVKLTVQDQPDTFRKIGATFESYWNSDEFEQYSEAQALRLAVALKA